MADGKVYGRGGFGSTWRTRPLSVAGLGVVLVLLAALSGCSFDQAGMPVPSASFAIASAAAPSFGAKASGSELETPGIVTDGGPGSSSASISTANFTAAAELAQGATYLPRLSAFSQNPFVENDDDRTNSVAEAYEVFTSSVGQTIDLTVRLSGIVDNGTSGSSYVLADVFVYGGPDFEVVDTPICADGRLGQYLFDGTYFCGSRFGRSNLYIPSGDVILLDTISFDVSAGSPFGVYAILRANSSGGTADASQTLVLQFADDQNISAVDFPGGPSDDLAVEIDVKPRSDQNSINLRSRGVVPVAILSAADFDATSVDPQTLRLSGAAVRTVGRRSITMARTEDVNEDGLVDLVVHFRTNNLEIDASDPDAELVLTGETFDGIAIRGTDTVRIVR